MMNSSNNNSGDDSDNGTDNNPGEDDNNLFRELFGDIERVESNHQQAPAKPRRPKPLKHAEDTAPAFEDKLLARPQIDPGETTQRQYQASGLQNKQMDKLRRGKIRPEATLDLHGMTREAALDAVQTFIQEARQQQLRCIHIVHGKGYRSEAGKAILKPAVAQWLTQMSGVMAYVPALPQDGGDGAVYVLLKRA